MTTQDLGKNGIRIEQWELYLIWLMLLWWYGACFLSYSVSSVMRYDLNDFCCSVWLFDTDPMPSPIILNFETEGGNYKHWGPLY